LDLTENLQPLRKWWWLILAAVAVATASSFIATRGQPPIYRALATVMIGRAIQNPNPSDSAIYLSEQLATTYADIAQRATVRHAAMTALGLTSLPDYKTKVVPNTQLLEISVVDTSPVRAQAVANELAHQLILQSPTGSASETQQRQAFVNTQLDDLEAKIKETEAELNKKQTDLAGMFSARQIADSQAQIAGLQSKQATLQANYASLLNNTQQGATNTISVIEPAALPTSPIGPNKGATILLGAAVGLILATAAAYLLEYLDDTVRNPDSIQKNLGLTTLGAVPVIAKAESGDELAVLANSRSAVAEAYRMLRTNLQFAAVDRPLRTLLITSPSPSEGKSLTVANLAVTLAQTGQRVIVVDADLHRPRQHRLHKLRNNVGLTTALLQEHPSLDGLLQETTVPGLQVLTSGPLPPNPAELLGSSRMRDLLAVLQAKADIVLLDSPPAVVLSDTAIVASQVDGTLLVLNAGTTRREFTRRAIAVLRQVNARIIGAVLNRMPAEGGGYYHYNSFQDSNYYTSGNGHHGDSPDGSGRRRRRHSKESPSLPAGANPPQV